MPGRSRWRCTCARVAAMGRPAGQRSGSRAEPARGPRPSRAREGGAARAHARRGGKRAGWRRLAAAAAFSPVAAQAGEGAGRVAARRVRRSGGARPRGWDPRGGSPQRAQRRRHGDHGGAAVVQRRRPRNRAGIGLERERTARRSSPATQFERREIGRWSSTARQSFSTEQQWRTRRRR